MFNLTDKAMLSRVSVSQWSARKHDKGVSDAVARDKGAANDAGRYNKALVAKSALSAINAAAGAARNFHYENTLPWLDDGQRILPSANFLRYTEGLRGFRVEFDAEVRKFLAGYDDYVEESRARLGDLFNLSDYPSAREIARKFQFDIVTLPIPAAADFRVALGDEEQARIRADIEARTNAAIEAALTDTWNRVHAVVAHMAERLRKYSVADDGKTQNPFRDSLVQNVRDLVELLPALNVTGDAALAKVTDDMKAQLCAYDPAQLREDAALRANVAEDANAILAAMAGYCGTVEQIAA